MVDLVNRSEETFDGILSPVKWQQTDLSFGFPTSNSVYKSGYGRGEPSDDFEELNATQKSAARQLLTQVESVSGLSFTEDTKTPGDATMRFAMSGDPKTARGYYPSDTEEGGDTWYHNYSSEGEQYYDYPVMGTFAFSDGFMHEIGHALGLEHGHEPKNDGDDETSTFGKLPYEVDSNEFSIMTYRDHVGDETDRNEVETYGNPQTFMMLDIAALQHMYGADYSDSGRIWSGDTTYTFDPGTGETFINDIGLGKPGGDDSAASNRILRTIWDGHGEDTYDLSNYTTDLDIDLRPGHWSTFAREQLSDLDGDGDRSTNLARGNVANALLHDGDTRSLIENATGGPGADRLVGNRAANDLIGGGGQDTLIGHAGDDLLKGQGGNDTLAGDAGNDTLVYGGGYDTLRGGAGRDQAAFQSFGDAVWVDLAYAGIEAYTRGGDDLSSGDWRAIATLDSIEKVHATSQDDALYGSAASETLEPGRGDDLVKARGGHDTLVFAGGNDVLDGGTGHDTADFSPFGSAVWVDLGYYGSTETFTRGRDDLSSGSWRGLAQLDAIERVQGSAYDDALYGNGADNWLNGRAGDDMLDGGAGADRLIYSGGLDTLNGGPGNDVASFAGASSAVWVDLAYSGAYEAYTRGGGDLDSGTWQTIASLSGIESLNGSRHDDELYGNAAGNRLSGGHGDDLLKGRGGPDTLAYANGGVDSLQGGPGTDAANFAQYDSAVWVDLGYYGTTEAFTRGGTDVDSGNWQAIASLASIENLVGTPYDDSLTGDSGDNVLNGLAGNDTLGYAGGADRLNGGSGTDTASFEAYGSAVWVDLGYYGTNEAYTRGGDDLSGGSWQAIASLTSIETVTGSAQDDFLKGDSDTNTLRGGAGGDELQATAGADTLIGGAGADSFVFTPGIGTARVADWQDGTDTLDLSAFSFDDFQAVDDRASTDAEGDLDIDLGGGDQVTLAGFSGTFSSDDVTL